MARLLLTLWLGAVVAVSAGAQDLHLSEPGSAAVLAHSAFAHGYMHGYEEGYHMGNTDICIGTMPRTKLKDVRGLKLGYSEQFGSRHVFEQGFHAGLKAGYGDGYFGRQFRAVDSLRAVSVALEDSHTSADPEFAYFDQGFFSGYNQGLERGDSGNSSIAQLDFHFAGCSNFHPAHQGDLSGEQSYCEGYRRGFALGQADGFVPNRGTAALEASK
jgi:hypothetical protein